MATGLIASRPTKIGDVLKHEYDPCTGYCRKLGTVTVPAGGLSIGAVLESTSVAGKFTLVAEATTANADAVLIDVRVNDETVVGGDFELAVLTRGPAQVADDSLTFAADIDTPAKREAAFAALTESTGIEVLQQV